MHEGGDNDLCLLRADILLDVKGVALHRGRCGGHCVGTGGNGFKIVLNSCQKIFLLVSQQITSR